MANVGVGPASGIEFDCWISPWLARSADEVTAGFEQANARRAELREADAEPDGTKLIGSVAGGGIRGPFTLNEGPFQELSQSEGNGYVHYRFRFQDALGDRQVEGVHWQTFTTVEALAAAGRWPTARP